MATRRRRVVVQDPNEGARRVRPAARPAGVRSLPRISAPIYDNEFQQLAELSPTLLEIGRVLAEEEREKREEAGRQAFLDPERRLQVQEKGFDALVRSGEIPEAGSPFFQMGFFESSARAAVTDYRERVLGRLDEAAQVVGPNGTLVETPTFEEIAAEEWERLEEQEKPTLNNFFGRAEAFRVKEEADLKLSGVFSAQKAENSREAHRRLKSRELTDSILDALDSDDPEAEVAEISQTISDEIWRRFEDPTMMVADTLIAASEVAAAEEGVDRALEILDLGEKIQMGGASLGKARAEVRAKLARQQESLEEQKEQEFRESGIRRREEVDAAVSELHEQWTVRLFEAKREGGLSAMRQERRAIEEEILAMEGLTPSGFSFKGSALEDLEDTYNRRAEADPIASEEVVAAIRRAMRDPEQDAEAILEENEINLAPTLVESLREEIEGRKRLLPYTFNFSPFTNFRSELLSEQAAVHLPPVLSRQLGSFFLQNEAEFQESYEAKVQELLSEGKTPVEIENTMAGWLRDEQGGRRFLTRREQKIDELEQAQRERLDSALERVNTGEDVDDVLASMEEEGFVSVKDKWELMAQAAEITDPVAATQGFVEEVISDVHRRLLDMAPPSELGPASLGPVERQRLDELRRDLEDTARERFTELRPGKTRKQFVREWSETMRSLRSDVLRKIETPEDRFARRRSQAVEIPEGDTEAQAAADRRTAALLEYRDAADNASLFTDWEDVDADSSVIFRDPIAPDMAGFYKSFAEALGDTHVGDGWWFDRDTPPDRVRSKWLKRIDKDAPDEFRPTDLTRINTVIRNGGITLSELMEGEISVGERTVPLDDLDFDPYGTPVFQSQDQLDRWLQSDPRETSLPVGDLLKKADIPWDSEKYPVPVSDPEVELWYSYQLAGIRRLNPNR